MIKRMDFIDNNYKELLLKIDKEFDSSNKSIHKARNEIKIIQFQGKDLVVKSFKIPNIINKIIYTFLKSSKAKKSYDNSIKIINFVPKPLAYIEFKRFGLLHSSYFISENFKYDFTIREPLLDTHFKEREKIFQEFANFTLKLHQDNIFHLDYSPGNILIKKEDTKYTFKIVDINRMQFKTLSLDDKLNNFSKLWAKDNDLIIIVKKYAKLIKENENSCVKIALKYSQAHKDRKNTKKRLRGQKVVD